MPLPESPYKDKDLQGEALLEQLARDLRYDEWGGGPFMPDGKRCSRPRAFRTAGDAERHALAVEIYKDALQLFHAFEAVAAAGLENRVVECGAGRNQDLGIGTVIKWTYALWLGEAMAHSAGAQKVSMKELLMGYNSQPPTQTRARIDLAMQLCLHIYERSAASPDERKLFDELADAIETELSGTPAIPKLATKYKRPEFTFAGTRAEMLKAMLEQQNRPGNSQ